MDNNFNQGQPIQAQPIQGQPIQGQPYQPQQQGQFDPFAGPAGQNTINQGPKKPVGDYFPLISIILTGVGLLMVFFGTLFTCTCSAKASIENYSFKTSAIFILTIFGILFAVAGIVLAILNVKNAKSAKNASKLALISLAVGIFAVLYGILPTVTVCGYNCSLNNEIESGSKDYSDYSDYLDYLDDYSNLFK